jgi:hypothetical protein
MAKRALENVKAEVKRLAALLGAPESDLPTFGAESDDNRAHVEIVGEAFHYFFVERGVEFGRVSTLNLDELLYQVFQHITFSLACRQELANRIPDEDPARQRFRIQEKLLTGLAPAWGERRKREQQDVLHEHPFDDTVDARVRYTVELRERGYDAAAAWRLACNRYPLPAPPAADRATPRLTNSEAVGPHDIARALQAGMRDPELLGRARKSILQDGSRCTLVSLLELERHEGKEEVPAIQRTMRLLESLMQADPVIAGSLMVQLYPVASGEYLYETCDAIELWMTAIHNAELAGYVATVAASEHDDALRTKYDQWAKALRETRIPPP